MICTILQHIVTISVTFFFFLFFFVFFNCSNALRHFFIGKLLRTRKKWQKPYPQLLPNLSLDNASVEFMHFLKVFITFWKHFWCITKWHKKLTVLLSPSRHLLAQNQQWKYQSNVWNMFKGNKKGHQNDVIDVGLMSFFVVFEQISHIALEFPLLTLSKYILGWKY